jgi:hypothetical protein
MDKYQLRNSQSNSVLQLPNIWFPSFLDYYSTAYFQLTSCHPFSNINSVKIKVTLRLAVYRQSVRLGVKPLETHDQTFLFFNLTPALIDLT